MAGVEEDSLSNFKCFLFSVQMYLLFQPTEKAGVDPSWRPWLQVNVIQTWLNFMRFDEFELA